MYKCKCKVVYTDEEAAKFNYVCIRCGKKLPKPENSPDIIEGMYGCSDPHPDCEGCDGCGIRD